MRLTLLGQSFDLSPWWSMRLPKPMVSPRELPPSAFSLPQRPFDPAHNTGNRRTFMILGLGGYAAPIASTTSNWLL